MDENIKPSCSGESDAMRGGTGRTAEPLYANSFGYSLAMRVMQSDVYRSLDGKERAECDELIARGQAPSADKAEPSWGDRDDKWTPEIDRAHPMQSGAHRCYEIAMEMVGNRHSKGALVDLVCWLVQKADRVNAGIESGPIDKPAPTLLREAMEAPTDEQIARMFHEAYERLAPKYGYNTRPETREFDPSSSNGQLMIAVVGEVRAALVKLRETLKGME